MPLELKVETDMSMCGLSAYYASIVAAMFQCMASSILGILYKMLLDKSVIVGIMFSIHQLCAVIALIFLVFCICRRKIGTFYEVLLHAYLLSILLMALTTLFSVLFLPLSFLQQPHSLYESMHYLFLVCAAAGMLAAQFFQRNLAEQMLSVMEYSFT